MRSRVLAIVLLCGGASLSCRDSSPLSPDGIRFRGQVSDPAGDASIEARVNPSPDLVGATIMVDGTYARLDVQFAPGRLDSATSTAQIALDIDEATHTGDFQADYGLGIEFLLNFVPEDGGIVKVFRYETGTGTYATVGTVPRVNVGNGWSASVPLEMLNGDDGRAAFRAICSAVVGPRLSAGILDYMPDASAAPGVVR